MGKGWKKWVKGGAFVASLGLGAIGLGLDLGGVADAVTAGIDAAGGEYKKSH